MQFILIKKYLIGFVILFILITIFVFFIKTPLLIETNQQTFYERYSIGLILLLYVVLGFFYYGVIYIWKSTPFGKRMEEYITSHFEGERREAERQYELVEEEHKTDIYVKQGERRLVDLKLEKAFAEANMQHAINKKIEELPKEDAMFVINAFIGKDKPFETVQDYNAHVDREHEKEMKNIDLSMKEQERRTQEAKTAQEEFRAHIKIKEEQGNPDDYIRKYPGKNDKK